MHLCTDTRNHPRRNSRHSRPGWHIARDHCIGPDHCVITDFQRPNQFGAGANVNVAAQLNSARKGDLVKNHAVHADFCIWMDDNSCRVGQTQAASDLGIQVDLTLRHH